MVYGSSGIGKTMIAKRMASRYPTQYNAELGVTKTPILLVQAPPAPDERRFYQHILSTIGAPMLGASHCVRTRGARSRPSSGYGSEDAND